MKSDQELLNQWARQRDEEAFRALVERHAGLVHGVAIRRTEGNRVLTEEIGQQVFAMLARKAAGLVQHPSLAAWLHRATVLECAHQLRREAARSRQTQRYAAHTATGLG